MVTSLFARDRTWKRPVKRKNFWQMKKKNPTKYYNGTLPSEIGKKTISNIDFYPQPNYQPNVRHFQTGKFSKN